MTQYGSLLGVELVSVGMEWPAHPEPITLRLEHLVDMMVAANDDPLISRPRIKLGHERWQFNETGVVELGDHDPFWQGEPAFGTATNLRLNDQGNYLLGDLVEMPWWMVEAAPSAWPNRSCEWVWNIETATPLQVTQPQLLPADMLTDFETEGGKRYSAVLTAVALLGVQRQAVKNLRDLARAMVDGPYDL